MIDKETYIEQQIAIYDDAFDCYKDSRQMPPSIPEDDLLGNYLKNVIDNNPQLVQGNETWVEVLKDELLTFFSLLLASFYDIEQTHAKEQAFIGQYQAAGLEKKRQLWNTLYQYVKTAYQPAEVNIDGYAELFPDNDVEEVNNALCKDWKKASDEKMQQKRQDVLENASQQWERNLQDCGSADYERRKQVEKIMHSYPALQEIVKIMGREQPENKDLVDDITYKYIPILVSTPISTVEIDQIANGNDLAHLLPVETALMSDAATTTLFYKKYAEHQLQIFANKPPVKAQQKIVQQNENKPRLQMGPIIVGIDTSGSMSGRPEVIAKSLLLQLLHMAKKKKRKCFVITFSVRAKFLELAKASSWKKLDQFLNTTFTGGTDGEEMLAAAVNALHTNDYSMADVLIISDFCFSAPIPATRQRLKDEHNKGTRFYGLQIGRYHHGYKDILDRIWTI